MRVGRGRRAGQPRGLPGVILHSSVTARLPSEIRLPGECVPLFSFRSSARALLLFLLTTAPATENLTFFLCATCTTMHSLVATCTQRRIMLINYITLYTYHSYPFLLFFKVHFVVDRAIPRKLPIRANALYVY